MNKHYDKICFVLALLVLAASAAFYFLNSPNISKFEKKAKAALQSGPQGEKWVDKDAKFTISQSMAWENPPAQSEDANWLFELFTPPKIWVDKSGKFITEAPITVAEEKTAFEIKFASVTSAVYGIKLTGYIGSAENPIFQFQNADNNMEFTGKKGVPISIKDPTDISGKRRIDLGFKVLDFKKFTTKNADNTITIGMTVVFEDKRLSKPVEISTGKPTLLPAERRIEIVSAKDPNQKWLIKNKGEKIEYNNSVYTVKDLSFDDAFVVVEQTLPEGKGTVTKKLDASGAHDIETK